MAHEPEWVRIKRSAAARFKNSVPIVGWPLLGTGYLALRHDGGYPVVATVIVAAIGFVLGGAFLCSRTGRWYHLRGSALRIRGKSGTVIDLATVRAAHLSREREPPDSLWLTLVDPDGHEVRIKLGDSWVRGDLSPDGLTAIADRLDQPTAPASRPQLVQWLRDYAYRPRAEDWPD
jgi:hypothetical protein